MLDPSQPEGDVPEPPQLRFLRVLVTVLTATMIAGMVLIIALIWIRFNAPPQLGLESLSLPEGETATAITRGDGWVAVVTASQKILIYDAVTGALTQSVQIETD